MLEHIVIDGFKSIRHLDLDMRPINILIGANGAGKTNFLSFFKLVNNIYEQRLQNYTMQEKADNLLFYGLKETKSISGSFNISGCSYSFSLQPSRGGAMYLASEGFSADGFTRFKQSPMDESSIKELNDERFKYMQSQFKSYKVYHFQDTGEGAQLRSASNLNDNHSLRASGRNLPSYLFCLQQKYPKAFKRIELTIRSVMPNFERFELEPDTLDGTKIHFAWHDIKYPDKYFDANDISDGTLRFIALTTLLLQPVLPEVIIIDEPELGLHPTAVNKFAGMIRSASRGGSQIIVSTQSVELINNFEPEDIITVDRKDGQSVFSRLNRNDLKEWIDDYSMGELWTKSVINGQPFNL